MGKLFKKICKKWFKKECRHFCASCKFKKICELNLYHNCDNCLHNTDKDEAFCEECYYNDNFIRKE